MEEIAANFSYEMIRLTDRILGFTRNRLYQGINVHNAERVRRWPTTVMSWCMCLATAVTWTTCYFLTCCTTGAGAAAYRRRDQPELLAGRADFPPSGGVLYSPYF